jgi:hypothetical protein
MAKLIAMYRTPQGGFDPTITRRTSRSLEAAEFSTTRFRAARSSRWTGDAVPSGRDPDVDSVTAIRPRSPRPGQATAADLGRFAAAGVDLYIRHHDRLNPIDERTAPMT